MRIYTRVVCAWQPDGTLKQEEADSFEYQGPLAHCGKDSPSPPPAPDYSGAARATQTSQRSNEVTPYGSQTYSARPTAPSVYTRTTTLTPTADVTINLGSINVSFTKVDGSIQMMVKPDIKNTNWEGVNGYTFKLEIIDYYDWRQLLSDSGILA